MTDHPLNMTAPPEVYRKRRARLAANLRRPMLILAGEARARQYATNTYPFRAGSNYLYFGGPPVAGAALLVEPQSNGDEGCALVRPLMDFEEAVWIGNPPPDEHLARVAGLRRNALVTSDQLAARIRGREGSFIGPPCPRSLKWAVSSGLKPAEPAEIQPIIDMRLIKDEYELTAMRRAAKVGIEAHLAAMRAAKPGNNEADVAAALNAVFIARQCRPSFTPIVTVHGEVLHSEAYANALEAGRLLLVDAGAEEPGGYASDITRTYPVTGRFTQIQRHLYDTVIRAQREAIAACVPGRRFRDIHDLAAGIICEGLVEAELLKGDPSDLASRGAHTLFFTHGLGHLIGLDVHDMEDFGDQAGYQPGRQRPSRFGSKYLRLDRDLLPGMTLTVEPGLYLVPAIWQHDALIAPFAEVINRSAVDALIKERFGGIRIEDTVCVRPAGPVGPEVLTGELPIEDED